MPARKGQMSYTLQHTTRAPGVCMCITHISHQKKLDNRTPVQARPFALTPVRREKKSPEKEKEELEGREELRSGGGSPFHIDPSSVQAIFHPQPVRSPSPKWKGLEILAKTPLVIRSPSRLSFYRGHRRAKVGNDLYGTLILLPCSLVIISLYA